MDPAQSPQDTPHVVTIPGFLLGTALGRGGFATVWEATPAGGGAKVAIKVGHSHSDVVVERFRREAEAMAKVGAPWVPHLVAFGQTETGRPYVVMERLFGETLETKLSALTRPPPFDWIAKVVDGLTAALSAIHEKGFLHRDIKPANIFFAEPGERVVLLDVGLAKASVAPSELITGSAATLHDDLTRTGVAIGTPEYMAPEQIRAERQLSVQADLYAVGVVLYELLTLRLPFSGSPAAVEHGHLLLRPRRPSELSPVPSKVEEVVLGCLAKDPSRRPKSAQELRALFALACQSEAEPKADTDQGPPQSKLIAEGRHPVVVAVIDARGDATNIAAAVGARGGFVPRQRGARYVAVFTGLDTEDPVRAATVAARELSLDHGARVALHFAEVTIRRKEKGAPAAYGAALERPESWLPPEPWSGVVHTAAMARLLPKDSVAYESTALGPTGESSAGDEVAPDTHVEAPLTGRTALLDAVAGSITATFQSRHPSLYTLVGDAGTGKTRLCSEVTALLARSHPPVRVVPMRAVPPGAGTRDRLTSDLLRALGDTPGATLPEGSALGHHGYVQAISEALRARSAEGPVAIVLDDAQWADDAVLDALEYASLDAAECPLWVFVAAHPRLLDVRPGWGKRTRNAERSTLAPLESAEAAALAGHLLAPAEYPPAALLDNLARWSGGNPASLTEIVRALKRAGVVRKRPGAAGYQVVTAALDALPPSPSWQWLATRRLAALPVELSACLRLGAVLGAAFTRDELEAVQTELERAGGAGTTVDAGAGLRALAAEGLLSAGAFERYSFSNALLHDAIYELIDSAQRVEVHKAALAVHLRSTGPDVSADRLASIARHAARAGARDEAARAHLRLGELAAKRHRHVEADQQYTAALSLMPEEDIRGRAVALKGRGASRILIDRARDAVSDLEEARGLATALDDNALVAELLLEEATALDWAQQFELSAQRAEEARPLVLGLDQKVLTARLQVAAGRTAWRQGRVAESIDLLEQGLVAARAAGDYSSRVIALLVVGWQLARVHRTAEAQARLAEAVDLTTREEDISHLCSAYLNRRSLWVTLGDLERAIEDLQQAITLARQSGSPHMERLACFNVSDLLYWAGRTEEAIALTRRGCLLAERFSDREEGWGPLYLALFHLDLGHDSEVTRLTEKLVQSQPYDVFGDTETARRRRVMLSVVELARAEKEGRAGTSSRWDELEGLAESIDVSGSSLLGVLYWRARTALERGLSEEATGTLNKASSWLPRSPLWRHRFDALAGIGRSVTIRDK